MKAYEKFLNSGCYAIGGHRFDPHNMRCVVVHFDGNTCLRKLDDVLSYVGTAQVGDQGVACVGALNSHELQTMSEAKELRDRACAEAVQ